MVEADNDGGIESQEFIAPEIPVIKAINIENEIEIKRYRRPSGAGKAQPGPLNTQIRAAY